jgi:hypothetical protein
MGMGGQLHAPTALTQRNRRFPLYSRRDGPLGRSAGVRKISPLPRFDSRIAQSVASRYTDPHSEGSVNTSRRVQCCYTGVSYVNVEIYSGSKLLYHLCTELYKSMLKLLYYKRVIEIFCI